MLTVGQVTVLRDKVEREGKSVRQAARELGISRVTARKWLEGKEEPGKRKQTQKVRPVLEVAAPRLAALVEEWGPNSTRKQRITAAALHKALLGEGIRAGFTTVRQWWAEHKRKDREVFVPLQHYPGQMAEVDFFEVTVDIAGVRQKAWMLVIRLMHSGRDFVWLYEHCDQLSLLDGHVRSFAHFGGVPQRMVYDNLKAAVKRFLLVGRELQSRFAALAAHYVFEPCFARPYTGHDKGGVESRGGHMRLQHLVPIPSAPSLVAASEALLARVDAQAAEQPRDGSPSRMQRFEAADVPMMLPLLRGAFDARRLETASADRSARVRLCGSRYSVPVAWACCEVEARIGLDQVELRCRGQVVTAPRCKPGQDCIQYRHYLPELRRKPQAVRQVMPALLSEIGAPFDRLWRLLVDQHGPSDAARVFARVLGAVVEHGEPAVKASIQAALEQNRMDLLVLMPRRRDERAPAVAVPAALAHHEIEQPSACQYDVLLGGD